MVFTQTTRELFLRVCVPSPQWAGKTLAVLGCAQMGVSHFARPAPAFRCRHPCLEERPPSLTASHFLPRTGRFSVQHPRLCREGSTNGRDHAYRRSLEKLFSRRLP